jgi:hypothetical protein
VAVNSASISWVQHPGAGLHGCRLDARPAPCRHPAANCRAAITPRTRMSALASTDHEWNSASGEVVVRRLPEGSGTVFSQRVQDGGRHASAGHPLGWLSGSAERMEGDSLCKAGRRANGSAGAEPKESGPVPAATLSPASTWRRGWDSNPRWLLHHTSLAGRPDRPDSGTSPVVTGHLRRSTRPRCPGYC